MQKVILLIGVLGLAMCKPAPEVNNAVKVKRENNFIIEGNLDNGNNKYLYFQEIVNNNFIPVDTILIDDKGGFKFEHESNFPSFYILKNEMGDYIILIPEPSEFINISGNYTFEKYMIENSPHSEIISDLYFKTRNFLSEISKIAAISRDSIHSDKYQIIKMNLTSRYDSLFNDLRSYSLDLINNNIQSPAIVLALFNQTGTDNYVFNPLDDLEIFSKVDSILYYLYPDFPPVKSLHEKVIVIKAQFALKEKQQRKLKEIN